MRLAEKARQVCGQRVGETFPLRRRRRGIQSVEIAVEAWLTAGAQPPREAAVDQIFLAAGERDPGAGIDHPLDALEVAGGEVKLAMGFVVLGHCSEIGRASCRERVCQYV